MTVAMHRRPSHGPTSLPSFHPSGDSVYQDLRPLLVQLPLRPPRRDRSPARPKPLQLPAGAVPQRQIGEYSTRVTGTWPTTHACCGVGYEGAPHTCLPIEGSGSHATRTCEDVHWPPHVCKYSSHDSWDAVATTVIAPGATRPRAVLGPHCEVPYRGRFVCQQQNFKAKVLSCYFFVCRSRVA